jgi:hypothetical protein
MTEWGPNKASFDHFAASMQQQIRDEVAGSGGGLSR